MERDKGLALLMDIPHALIPIMTEDMNEIQGHVIGAHIGEPTWYYRSSCPYCNLKVWIENVTIVVD